MESGLIARGDITAPAPVSTEAMTKTNNFVWGGKFRATPEDFVLDDGIQLRFGACAFVFICW